MVSRPFVAIAAIAVVLLATPCCLGQMAEPRFIAFDQKFFRRMDPGVKQVIGFTAFAFDFASFDDVRAHDFRIVFAPEGGSIPDDKMEMTFECFEGGPAELDMADPYFDYVSSSDLCVAAIVIESEDFDLGVTYIVTLELFRTDDPSDVEVEIEFEFVKLPRPTACEIGCNITSTLLEDTVTKGSDGVYTVPPLAEVLVLCGCHEAYGMEKARYHYRWVPDASCADFFVDPDDEGYIRMTRDASWRGDVLITPPLGFNGCTDWALAVDFTEAEQPWGSEGYIEVAKIRLDGPNPYQPNVESFTNYSRTISDLFTEDREFHSVARLILNDARSAGIRLDAATRGILFDRVLDSIAPHDTAPAQNALHWHVFADLGLGFLNATELGDFVENGIFRGSTDVPFLDDYNDRRFGWPSGRKRLAAALEAAYRDAFDPAVAGIDAPQRCGFTGPRDSSYFLGRTLYVAPLAPIDSGCTAGTVPYVANADGVVVIDGIDLGARRLVLCGPLVTKLFLNPSAERVVLEIPQSYLDAFIPLYGSHVVRRRVMYSMAIGAAQPDDGCATYADQSPPSGRVVGAVIEPTIPAMDFSMVVNGIENNFNITGLTTGLNQAAGTSFGIGVALTDAQLARQQAGEVNRQVYFFERDDPDTLYPVGTPDAPANGCAFYPGEEMADLGDHNNGSVSSVAIVRCSHLTGFVYLDVIGPNGLADDGSEGGGGGGGGGGGTDIFVVLGDTYVIIVLVVTVVVGVVLEGMRMATNVAMPGGKTPVRTLLDMVQRFQAMAFLGAVPSVYRRIGSDVSFVNFISPSWWGANDQWLDSVAREFGAGGSSSRRLLQHASASASAEGGALVGIERYAAAANINVDTMLLNTLLIVAVVLVGTTAILSLVAWLFRGYHTVPGFIAAKGVGYAFQAYFAAFLGLTMVSSFSLTFADTLEGAATVTFVMALVVYAGLSITLPAAVWAHIQTKGGHRVDLGGEGAVEIRRHTPKYMARCGAAYENYRRSRHWFGAIYIAKKFVTASVIGFLSGASGAQILLLVAAELAYFVSFLAFKPTDDKHVWILEATVSFVAAFNYALLIPYTDLVAEPVEASPAYAAITIVVQFVLMGATVGLLIYKAYGLIKGGGRGKGGKGASTQERAPRDFPGSAAAADDDGLASAAHDSAVVVSTVSSVISSASVSGSLASSNGSSAAAVSSYASATETSSSSSGSSS